jgi:ATP-binding cassette subfamily C (CFTR/MRP) protein 1
MDSESDALMQKILRDELVGTTIIVVAHRLETIIDFDRILVMDSGEIVECDSPKNLLSRASNFKDLLNDSTAQPRN